VRPGLCAEVRFDDDHHVERPRKIGVQKLCLIDTGVNAIFYAGGLKILFWDVMVIHPVSVFAMRATALVRAVIRKAQGGIPTQLGDQVQSSLANHLEGRVVAKMPIQGQVSRSEQTTDPQKQGFEHLLNALHLGVEGHFRLVFVLAAFGAARFALRSGYFGFFRFLFGFGGCFFFFAAYRLLHRHRIGAPLIHTDQGDSKERQARDYLLLQPREKMIQPVGLLPGFADHTFITCQHVDVLLPKQVLAKELPEYLRPWDGCAIKSLDRAVAAAFSGPARQPQHRDPPGHG